MKTQDLLFATSWVVLLVVAAGMFVLSLQSLYITATDQPDGLTAGMTLDRIREVGGENAVIAFRARRITAATWALAYSLLFAGVVVFPYRRGEPWAWGVLAVSLFVSQALSFSRVLLLGTAAGLRRPVILFAVAIFGLLAGLPRISKGRANSAKAIAETLKSN